MAFHPPSPFDVSALERERIARIRSGDEAAFEAMYREYYDPLCRYVAQFLGGRDQAEDVVQGVFARVWRDRERLVASDLRHYLYAAVRRRTVSEFRYADVRRRTAPFVTLEMTARQGAATADAEFEAEELRHRLERALSKLPPRTREAFELTRGEGCSYHEVALRMGISPKTVGVHIANALAALRKVLTK